MPIHPVERKLAAIFAADIAGYSRLMGQDEVGTLTRLKALRHELIDPMIGEHKGRIVKTTGDGILIEFPSVVEAVSCAVEMQRGMAERNADVPTDQRIEFRVGIHQGDIIVEDGDIFGDGVNLSARLEGLAEPGGISVSGRVRSDVAGKVDVSFDDLGEQSLKNIARPVRVYRVRTGAPPKPQAAQPNPRIQPASRLSIVVLPFANLSSDPEQEYFVDAVTDDLTTDLSRIDGSFVISRTTAFAYKGKPADAKQIGRDLGVRYIIEGSVRRLGSQAQVNVQMIAAESGAHVWADRFTVDCTDLALAQDEITARLAAALRLELIETASREIDQEGVLDRNAGDLMTLGWARYYRPSSEINWQQGQEYFERALELYADSVSARVGLACVLGERLAMGKSVSRSEDVARADRLLNEALDRDRNNTEGRAELGRLRRLQGRLVESKIELEQALAADRNNGRAMMQLGITLIFLGEPASALPVLERRLRVSRNNQNVWFAYYWLGQAHLLLGDIDQAVAMLRRGRSANPNAEGVKVMLTAALALQGDVTEAKAIIDEVLERRPGFSSLAGLNADYVNWNASPAYVALRQKTVDVGLRLVGLPDE